MDTANKIIARIAGVVLLLFGAGLAGFALWALAVRIGFGRTGDPSVQITFAVALGLGVVLSVMGLRLAANRPNRYGAILPPMGFRVLALLLAALAATFVVLAIRHRETEQVSGFLLASVMAWWCWTAAQRTQARASGASVPADNPLGQSGESRSGYFRLLTLRGIPIFVHVSLPVGGAMFAAYAGFDFRNSFYYCVGYVLLVGAHEAGHAVAAILLGIKVRSIDISGAGGLCRIETPRKVSHAAVVYSGGIAVQLILLAGALVYIAVAGHPTSRLGQSLITTLTAINVLLLVLNLIPSRTGGLATDGAVLWQLFRRSIGRHPNPSEQYVVAHADASPVFPPETRLLTKPALVPKDFKQGIEILNDSKTSMEVVVECLIIHLGLAADEALSIMLMIHNEGGVLLALPSKEHAAEVAAAITAEAKQQGFALVCRAVEIVSE